MYRVFSLLAILAFCGSKATPVTADENHGTLASVVKLKRINPKQSASQKRIGSNEIGATSYASAFLADDLVEGGEHVFLVTAAHNLVDCTGVEVSHDHFQDIPLLKPNAGCFKTFAYVDLVEDIAIFEWHPIYATYLRKKAGRGVNPRSVETISKIWKNERFDALPRGGVAASAGTITESCEASKYPAYSCTISRYATGLELRPPLDPRFEKISSNSSLNDFRSKVADRIDSTSFLVVESMSIAAGFSGSPIMISKDHFVSDGEVIGVVLGGQHSSGVGRFVWAATSAAVKRAIETVKQANASGVNWPVIHEVTPRIRIHEQLGITGRWLVSGDIETIQNIANEKFATPYSDRFCVESQIEFLGLSKEATLCKDNLKERIASLPGRSFIFRRITFEKDCLDGVNLLTPYFYKCTFKDTLFRKSVLTGPVFEDCSLFDFRGNSLDIKAIMNNQCSTCSSAAIIAPLFKGLPDWIKDKKDDLLQ